MVTQINPFQQQVWLSTNELQVGLGPERVVLDSLSKAEERFLASLVSGIADNQVEPLAKQLKLDSSLARNLVAKLKPVLLYQIMAEPSPSDFLDGELVRATLNSNSDGYNALTKRASKAVYLSSLGRTGVSIATALAKARISAIFSDDAGRVTKSEGSYFLKSLVNCSRIAALDFQMREFGLATKVTHRSFDKASVSVLIAQQFLSPKLYAPLMNRELPHIAVVFDHLGVTVSPLIVPGETACMYCFEQNKVAENPKWPVIASQLVTGNLAFDDSIANNFAAAACTKLITDWIDFGRSAELAIRWNAVSGKIEHLKFEPSTACDCLLQLRIKQGEKPRALAS